MDTWLLLGNEDVRGRHRRGLYVLKSRGMAHSNELCEFAITDHGLKMRNSGEPAGASGVWPFEEEERRHAGV